MALPVHLVSFRRHSITLQDLLQISSAPEAPGDVYESLSVLIIGSSADVTETIHNLHARGFAETGA